jgi:hypothetical protein
MRRALTATLLLLGLFALPRPAATAGTVDFQPDPKSVQRYGPAYRYPQAGWIVLHIEGKPYQRGYQHGRLLAPEIAAYLRCFAAVQCPQSPKNGWKLTRTLVNSLFVRRYAKEYLAEMRGIADGAGAAGARFDDRPIDLVDIVALNSWPEIDTLDSALNATANGLESARFRHAQPEDKGRPKPMHCSAFAATGPATADGKIVFGHITMFGLYPSLHYNVWLDVQPPKDHGHRVLMQTYPGGIQSGLDYYLNDAGLLVCETTIAQTKFDIKGLTVASRIRETLQYADTIDKAVDILKKANNGLYTNEWLLADINTNEIAMFELGTHKSKLYRSSKNEWFGGTEGFYWGCNNTKDLDVRLETVASVKGRPANVVFCPSPRDKLWQQLYNRYKGRIDANFGKIAFTTPPVAAYHSLDAKFTTTDLAKDLKTWAVFGPPLGRTWHPTHEERKLYPEIRPLVSNPWTVLHTRPPAPRAGNGYLIADLSDHVHGKRHQALRMLKERNVGPAPAWHGTLLPRTDADTWLAAGFAEYERVYAREKAVRKEAGKEGLTPEDRANLAVDLFAHRVNYLAAARATADAPLGKTHAELTRDDWYRIASGKGVWVLHELRKLLGDKRFEPMMDSFGRAHAGEPVSAAQFQAHAAKAYGKPLDDFFTYWLNQTGLPAFEESLPLTLKSAKKGASGYVVEGEIRRQGKYPPALVPVTVETADGEVTQEVTLSGPATRFRIETKDRPRRVVVDKYGSTAKANGGTFSVLSFHAELDKTLIVYGTADEAPTNREAAELLQKDIIRRGSNITVPVRSDREVTLEDLRAHHLLLIGRPDSNRVVERMHGALPVAFGSRSFVVDDKSYAHSASAVIAAGANPLNKRYSVVVLAGLSAEATLRTVPALVRQEQLPGEVIVMAHGEKAAARVLPARGLVRVVEAAGLARR